MTRPEETRNMALLRNFDGNSRFDVTTTDSRGGPLARLCLAYGWRITIFHCGFMIFTGLYVVPVELIHYPVDIFVVNSVVNRSLKSEKFQSLVLAVTLA
jgi:hypothetical protein